ncbi:arginine--tRNA ligase, chloroplastic/mitochondrial [Tanacetum coccineum]
MNRRRPSTTRAKKPRTTDKVPTTDEVPTTTDQVPTIDEVLQKPIDELIKEHGRFPLCFELNLLINKALHNSFPPHLKGKLSYFQRLEGEIRKHVVDGDYICYSIVRVCEILRSKIPCFRNTSSKDIAKIIMYSFPKSDMVKELKQLDVGFLSFKLNGDWMAKRIRKNLKDGIAAWAPILPAKRVIVDFPEQDIDAERHADGVRSTYIRDLLVRMLEYSGVEVCGKIRNKQSLLFVKKDFPEEEGVIRNKRKDSLFVRKKKATLKPQTNNVHEDLAALWYGEYVQKAHWIFYVTPVRQREYILKCFDAARDFVKEDQTSMRYLGYQTSSDEKEKLALLWDAFKQQQRLASGFTAGSPLSYRASKLGMVFGYGGPEAIFECMIRYDYLKKYTYSVCTFEDEEIFGLEGNNFLNLLETRFLIRRVLEDEFYPNLESNKALVGREREMGLHLLQFTEIIEESVLKLKPHSLCEYLHKLSKNFTSFIYQTKPSETQFLLCKAAEVVLEKGFDLLGITPESSNISRLTQQTGKLLTRDHYIALPVLRVSDMYGIHPDKGAARDRKVCLRKMMKVYSFAMLTADEGGDKSLLNFGGVDKKLSEALLVDGEIENKGPLSHLLLSHKEAVDSHTFKCELNVWSSQEYGNYMLYRENICEKDGIITVEETEALFWREQVDYRGDEIACHSYSGLDPGPLLRYSI